ncbi:MAG: serine dehydratase subunit alpha family protein [Oscillospiraceae bacterium]
MMCSDQRYRTYVAILHEELLPAMGCTEPISIALAAATAREALHELPARIEIYVSNNIIKNVKSVVVPNTGGQKGIAAAVAIGTVAGEAQRMLEVISNVTNQNIVEMQRFLRSADIEVHPAQDGDVFDIRVIAYNAAGGSAACRIQGGHTNITEISKDGKPLLKTAYVQALNSSANRKLLTVEGIVDFAESCCLDDISAPIERQIAYNSAISKEGLQNAYGANIGKLIWRDDSVRHRAIAFAAAGSDARMSGCNLPVIINSGSGNQGITASLPVIEYAKELDVCHGDLLRALAMSNLLTVHLRYGIGTLSAYCGAVSAGCAAGAAIAWMRNRDLNAVAHTLVNSLAIVSGIICDGAKPSCAAKIAFAVEAGLFGADMYDNGQQFYGGDGIVKKGVENTIQNIYRLGKYGMRQTDNEIVDMMISS